MAYIPIGIDVDGHVVLYDCGEFIKVRYVIDDEDGYERMCENIDIEEEIYNTYDIPSFVANNVDWDAVKDEYVGDLDWQEYLNDEFTEIFDEFYMYDEEFVDKEDVHIETWFVNEQDGRLILTDCGQNFIRYFEEIYDEFIDITIGEIYEATER